jgi:MFS family permease
VLAPQPSEDPNDPLNFSTTRKAIILSICGFGTILCAATLGPLLNAGLAVIAADFGKPIGDITLVSGYQLLVVGASGPFVCAFSRKWGKRPVFLFSSLSALIGTIIGSATNDYGGFLASRVVQGLSASAYESLIIAVIGDLYFVHERGFYMAIIQFFTGAVSNFSSVICGPITTGLGWKYLFHIFIALSPFNSSCYSSSSLRRAIVATVAMRSMSWPPMTWEALRPWRGSTQPPTASNKPLMSNWR